MIIVIIVSAIRRYIAIVRDRVLARSQSATAISITCAVLIYIFCKTVKTRNWMDIYYIQ